MKIHTVNELGNEIRQGSRDWFALRLGIPTASQFSKIIQPVKREYSKAAHPYIAELIAEQILGEPIDASRDDDGNMWTERGIEMEAKAREWYELEKGVKVRQVAFLTDDEHTEGASPDGLVGDEGAVEIKVFGAAHHTRVALGLEDVAPVTQVQGIMRVGKLKWIDTLAWHPKLAKVVRRVHFDEGFQADLDECMTRFKADMAKAKERLLACGDVIEDDGTLALLAASVAKKKTGPKPADDAEAVITQMYGPTIVP